ncbi:MAG: hypothetical protein K0R51_3067 [Cytophagaceae bacterium]|nr:hypothetical protein [Cytophagaceae bacterium]
MITLEGSNLSGMKNKITLSIDHNNAKRMAYFLNAVEDELKEIPFDWKNWALADRIVGACKFFSTTTQDPLSISLVFCDSYSDANEIGKANSLAFPQAKWSVNGDVLFFVACDDKYKGNDVLSLFAGEE